MGRSRIEWTDAVWNPVTGCTKVSEGCRNCYAERMAKRLARRCGYPMADPFAVTLHPEKVDQPLYWRGHQKIFVCSMGDLFHEAVPSEFISKIFRTMWHAWWHTFIVLTKRPERMVAWYDDLKDGSPIVGTEKESWPLPNVWLGVSVENQAAADKRIPLLLQAPAAVRFVSCEPLLGPINLEAQLAGADEARRYINGWHGIDWVIVGGESGPNARPMHPDWVRSIRDQCLGAGVPFFFKQWGEYIWEQQTTAYNGTVTSTGAVPVRCGKKAAGRLLDGKLWEGFPI